MSHRTPEEKQKAFEEAKRMTAIRVLKEQKQNIRYAQYALLIIGVGQFIYIALGIFWSRISLISFWPEVVIGLLFIGLYFLSREKLKLAFNAGLLIYMGIQLILILADKNNLYKGIIIKIIIFSTLFGGLKALKRIPKSLLDKPTASDVLDEIDHRQDLE